MKRFGYGILLMVLVVLLVAGCGGGTATEPEAAPQEAAEAFDPEAAIAQLEQAMVDLKAASNLRQVIDFDIAVTFSEAMLAPEAPEFAAQLVAMMSSITMHLDMAFEGYDYTNVMDNSDMKAAGVMDVAMGEMAYQVEMYIDEGRVYIDDGINGLVYTADTGDDSGAYQDQMDMSTYMLDDIDLTDVAVEETTLVLEGQEVPVVRYTLEDSLEQITKILQSDATMGNLIGPEEENPLEAFALEEMTYNLYVDRDGNLVYIEIAFALGVEQSELMMGIEKIGYQVTVLIDGIGETVVELPDLSNAVEMPAQ